MSPGSQVQGLLYDYGIDFTGLGIGTSVSHEESQWPDDAITPLEPMAQGDAKRAISKTNT